MDDYKYAEEDEKRLVAKAKEIDLPLVDRLTDLGRPIPTLEFMINDINHTNTELTKMDSDAELEIVCGEKLFRRYEELKNITATAVVTAEAILAAEESDYEFRFLKPEEHASARAEIMKYRHKLVGTCQPIAVFEKPEAKHYLCVIKAAIMKIMLIGDKTLEIDERKLYDPNKLDIDIMDDSEDVFCDYFK